MALENRLGILLDLNLSLHALGPHESGMLNVVQRQLHARETVLIVVKAPGKAREKFTETLVVVLNVINERKEIVRHLAHALPEGVDRKLIGGRIHEFLKNGVLVLRHVVCLLYFKGGGRIKVPYMFRMHNLFY